MEMAEGIGIVLGLIVIGGIIYAVASSSNNGSSNTSGGKPILKPLNDLIKNQVVLDSLNGSYVVNWFKANDEFKNTPNVVRMIAYPTKTILNGFGYEFNPNVDINSNVMLCYVNQETGTLLKYQWVAFKEMDSSIKGMFTPSDEFVIFDD
jgi:hypothetical protein